MRHRRLLVIAILLLFAMSAVPKLRVHAQATATSATEVQPSPGAAPEPSSSPAEPAPWAFWLVTMFFLALLLFFLGYLVPYTNIIRDQGPDPGPTTFKTYSLSRCQMALWFFVVLGAYLFIYLKSGHTTLSDTALWLMGISFGTTAAAKAVDSGKVAQAQTQQAAIAPRLTRARAQLQTLQTNGAPPGQIAGSQAEIVDLQKLLADAQQGAMPQPSQSFVPDLLTDDGGASLHRFQ